MKIAELKEQRRDKPTYAIFFYDDSKDMFLDNPKLLEEIAKELEGLNAEFEAVRMVKDTPYIRIDIYSDTPSEAVDNILKQKLSINPDYSYYIDHDVIALDSIGHID